MSTKSCRCVTFSTTPTLLLKPQPQFEVVNDAKVGSGLQQRSDYRCAVGFMGQLKAKIARALRFTCVSIVSDRRRRRSSRRVCSSSLARSRSYAEPIDSHRAEAVEDCIQFLNASSFPNFRRSSSVCSNLRS
ncbi:hypothetical protein QQ045_030121 [Rhodiola kirilowii]